MDLYPEYKLLKELKAGKEEAYMYLFKKHYKPLCLYAFQYVSDKYISEAIVSDLFFYIWEKRKELQITQSLRAYLVRATKNRCLNYLKRKTLTEYLDPDTDTYSFSDKDENTLHLDNPLTLLIEKELDIKMQESLATLPPATRQIFEYSRFENLKYNEIAEKMNVSTDVVKYHIKKALSRLREDLKDYFVIILAFILFFL